MASLFMKSRKIDALMHCAEVYPIKLVATKLILVMYIQYYVNSNKCMY